MGLIGCNIEKSFTIYRQPVIVQTDHYLIIFERGNSILVDIPNKLCSEQINLKVAYSTKRYEIC